MNTKVIAAITAAVNEYMEQEALPEPLVAAPVRVPHLPEASPWRIFGRQEAVRVRARWQAGRRTR